jgi:hypothetical protein
LILAELSIIELAWLIIATVGLVFAVLNLASARSDLVAARLVLNYRRDTRLVLASGAVQRNWIRVGVFAWWVLLGIGFGFFDLPDIPRIGGLLGLVGTAAGLAYTGIHEANERREVANLLAGDVADDLAEEHQVEMKDANDSLTDRNR